jgi:Rrf2 family protein
MNSWILIRSLPVKITSQEEYGLRCLLQLAQLPGDHASLTIPEVAANEGLSVPYVAKLLAVLRQAGIIESVRGRTGGYRLSRSSELITIGSVLLALGEPLFDETGYCQRHAGSESHGSCVHHGDCTLRALWQTLERWMRHALNEITLADFLQGAERVTELVRCRLAESAVEVDVPLITLSGVKGQVAAPASAVVKDLKLPELT